MRFTTAQRMATIDRVAIEDHRIAETALMETAGRAVAHQARARLLPDTGTPSVLVACGRGHNGADGLVAARRLGREGCNVTVVLSDPLEDASELTRRQTVDLRRTASVDLLTFSEEDPWPNVDLLVDGLLGTGLSGDPRPPFDAMIRRLNDRSTPVAAIDVPSGLSGDEPHPFDPCVRADLTVTFGLPKLGLLAEPGYARAGHVVVQELGFPPAAYEDEAGPFHLVTPHDVRGFLPRRGPTDHKGDAGRLAVVAGSDSYPGAAFLAGRAGSTAGAGLTALVGPEGLHRHQGAGERDLVFPFTLEDILNGTDTEDFLDRQDAFVVGPGLTTSRRLREGLKDLLPELSAPVVVDADGLNNLTEDLDVLRETSSALLTPHPGEAARLLNTTVEAVQSAPLDSLHELGERTGGTVVLKTSRPLVHHPDGTVSLNVSGSPALAKAGSGDVLTGLLGGLLAQGLRPGPAACLGVYLHGAAGRLAGAARPTVTVRSTDLLDSLPRALDELKRTERPGWFPLTFRGHPESLLSWHPFPN